MLKPKKKITMKEMKRDPLLEIIFNIRNFYDHHQIVIKRAGIAVAGVLLIGVIYVNRSGRVEQESVTALGRALVAVEKNDPAETRRQLELVIAEFDGTHSGVLARYYLGKLYFEDQEMKPAIDHLEMFVDDSPIPWLTCSAYQMLAEIYADQGDWKRAVNRLQAAVRVAPNLEIKIGKQVALSRMHLDNGNITESRAVLNKVLANKDIPAGLKPRVEELEGLLIGVDSRL